MSDSEVAIRVENLGKKYRLGLTHAGSIREVLNGMSHRVKRVLRPGSSLPPDPSHLSPACPLTTDNGQLTTDNSVFWALNDVSFDVRRGEVLGIIGRNGAGKSTLLKILSRVTKPTTGRAEIHGRVGSLLEVGTGFHPELTGRENVYLNGAILGMTKREIDRKFDEIVDFSGVQQFIDTPVKRYSSGMHVRLGFAVAAHLEPEILLVDEVLAVGDVEFQQKCLSRMDKVAQTGRTVLFVSHNMAAVENLCGRSVWLNKGSIEKVGPTREIARDYVAMFARDGSIAELDNFVDRSGNGRIRIVKVELIDKRDSHASRFRMGESITIRLTARANHGLPERVTVGIFLHTDSGLLVSDFRTNHAGFDAGTVQESACFELSIDPVLLCPGTYVLSPWISDVYLKEDFDWVKHAAKFTVESANFLGSGACVTSMHGIVHIPARWSRTESAVSRASH